MPLDVPDPSRDYPVGLVADVVLPAWGFWTHLFYVLRIALCAITRQPRPHRPIVRPWAIGRIEVNLSVPLLLERFVISSRHGRHFEVQSMRSGKGYTVLGIDGPVTAAAFDERCGLRPRNDSVVPQGESIILSVANLSWRKKAFRSAVIGMKLDGDDPRLLAELARPHAEPKPYDLLLHMDSRAPEAVRVAGDVPSSIGVWRSALWGLGIFLKNLLGLKFVPWCPRRQRHLTARLTCPAHTDLGTGVSILVPSTCASDFDIDDIRVRDESIFALQDIALPATIFQETGIAMRFSAPEIRAGDTITFAVRNLSWRKKTFDAFVWKNPLPVS